MKISISIALLAIGVAADGGTLSLGQACTSDSDCASSGDTPIVCDVGATDEFSAVQENVCIRLCHFQPLMKLSYNFYSGEAPHCYCGRPSTSTVKTACKDTCIGMKDSEQIFGSSDKAKSDDQSPYIEDDAERLLIHQNARCSSTPQCPRQDCASVEAYWLNNAIGAKFQSRCSCAKQFGNFGVDVVASSLSTNHYCTSSADTTKSTDVEPAQCSAKEADDETPGWVIPVVIVAVMCVCCLAGLLLFLLRRKPKAKITNIKATEEAGTVLVEHTPLESRPQFKKGQLVEIVGTTSFDGKWEALSYPDDKSFTFLAQVKGEGERDYNFQKDEAAVTFIKQATNKTAKVAPS
jgi:hypothetical protein